jgi:20S proteasome subunit beta 1
VLLATSAHAHTATPIDLGTTLIAVKYKDGVVLAADTRTSMSGYVSHRYADKIVPVSSHCLVARSGSAADTQMLAHVTKQQILDRSYRYGMATTVSQTARLMESLIGSSSDELGVSLLIAGYDTSNGAGRIYSLAASGALLEEGKFAIAGSGSTFIAGYMDKHAVGDELLDEAAAIQLCRNAMQLAMARDASSGGFVRIFICNGKGIRHEAVHPDARDATSC